MNTEINNTKRKKRRTRKCLNEIRKRSQRYGSHLNKKYACDSNDKIQVLNQNNNNLIMNRLTLPMFPKAVRSETITRHVLAEMKHKHNLNDIVKDKNSPTLLNTAINKEFQIICDGQNNTSDILSEAKEFMNDRTSAKENESPFGSFILVSPIYQDKEIDISVSNETEIASELIKPFSPRPHEDNSELCKNFIKELPHLLGESVPEIFTKYNVIKNLRAQLDEISSEDLKSPPDTVTITKRDKSIINRVVQNPIEYIRLTQTAPADLTESHNSSSGPSEAQPCIHSPLLYRSTSTIQDTPEYNYYPHKLY